MGLVLWVVVDVVVVCWVVGVVFVILVGVEGFIVKKSMLYGLSCIVSGLTTKMTTILTTTLTIESKGFD